MKKLAGKQINLSLLCKDIEVVTKIYCLAWGYDENHSRELTLDLTLKGALLFITSKNSERMELWLNGAMGLSCDCGSPDVVRNIFHIIDTLEPYLVDINEDLT